MRTRLIERRQIERQQYYLTTHVNREKRMNGYTQEAITYLTATDDIYGQVKACNTVLDVVRLYKKEFPRNFTGDVDWCQVFENIMY